MGRSRGTVASMVNAIRIRRLRETRGLTQQQLADMSSVSLRTIAEIEAGKANPKINTLAQVARSLGVSVKSLVTG